MVSESYVFYRGFYDSLHELEPGDRLETYDALNALFFYGQPYEGTNKVTKALLHAFRPVVESASARYVAAVENGKKGGAPQGNSNASKQFENNPKQPKNNLKQPKTT